MESDSGNRDSGGNKRHGVPSLRGHSESCTACPRKCRADRSSDRLGYCETGSGFAIASICAHRGEEPILSGTHGICNIFFAHCNLQCIYCQNHDISSNRIPASVYYMELSEIVRQIEAILDAGATGVGFVSPSHSVLQMRTIMDTLRARGRRPTYVFNTNGYDRRQMIASLEGLVDVYLPDLKYMDDALALEYSDVGDYTATATAAIEEMFRQKGSELTLDSDGLATSGLIIRHLVLPGQVDNSKAVLRFIARELSPDVHVSLMSQYHPTPAVAHHPTLWRCLTPDEYEEVLEEFDNLGLHRGWRQDLSSPSHYLPDFFRRHPFEE